MFYEDYFTRIVDINDFNEKPYKTKISGINKDSKATYLFQDCFANHVDFDNPFVDEITYDSTHNATREVQRDTLSSYFINKIYSPPTILNYDNDEEIDFDIFVEQLIENSYSLTKSPHYNLGSNRQRFLVGNVGEGKSALTKKVISEIARNFATANTKRTICCIYINFEDHYNYGSYPAPIQNSFLEIFYQNIKEKVEQHIDISELCNLSNIKNEPYIVIKRLLQHLKDNGIQLIVFLDNIDFYHYYYARYSYFEEYYIEQDRAINDNIMWLYSLFSKQGKLGDQGLNILFSIRSYVYEDIVANMNGTDTEIDTTKAYRIKLLDENEVVESRIELLKAAINIIVKENLQRGQKLEEYLVELRAFFFSKNPLDLTANETSPIKQIYKIGQHGYRTLVQFFSSLNIAYTDIELLDRFFNRQVSSLILMYYTNLYQRYSQEKEHFPNLFLNDCVISYRPEFKNAHMGHQHTYWLKYFILKYIVNEGVVKFQKIIDVFHTIGGYDLHLVKHVVGSLGTANEFRCIYYCVSESPSNIYARKLRATERGKYFFEKVDGHEVALDIRYLEVITEDKWLSIPSFLAKEFYDVNSDYSHLFKTGKEYIDISIDKIVSKTKSSLIFLKLLKESYRTEIERNKKELHAILASKDMIPDLETIINQELISSSEILLANFKRDVTSQIKEIKDFRDEIVSDERIGNLLKEYYSNPTDKKKVR